MYIIILCRLNHLVVYGNKCIEYKINSCFYSCTNMTFIIYADAQIFICNSHSYYAHYKRMTHIYHNYRIVISLLYLSNVYAYVIYYCILAEILHFHFFTILLQHYVICYIATVQKGMLILFYRCYNKTDKEFHTYGIIINQKENTIQKKLKKREKRKKEERYVIR